MVARFRNLRDAVRHVRQTRCGTHAHPFYTLQALGDLVLPGPERDCLNGRMSRHGTKYEILKICPADSVAVEALRGFWRSRSDKKAH